MSLNGILAFKRKEMSTYDTTWVNLEDIALRTVIKEQKDKIAVCLLATERSVNGACFFNGRVFKFAN